jgi:4-methylaminobutanoate oxidase (formaldehyde-forming)
MAELGDDLIRGLTWGIDGHILSPEEVKKLVPSINKDLITGALYTPSDGKCDPVEVSYSLSEIGKKAGVQIHEDVVVNRFCIQNNKIKHVETSAGEIKAGVIINSAGLLANQISKMTYRDLLTTSL